MPEQVHAGAQCDWKACSVIRCSSADTVMSRQLRISSNIADLPAKKGPKHQDTQGSKAQEMVEMESESGNLHG